jgi:ABC-2 type transport system permease protein/ribosome-dependent ATPase
MSWRRVWAVIGKEWREILRDRVFFCLAFIMPALWMWFFCVGMVMDVEDIPFAVVDHDRTPLSRDYVYRFVGSRYFDFKGMVTDERELAPLFADSRIRLALLIPPRFQEAVLAGREVAVQTLIDGTFTFRAETAKSYVIAMNEAVNEELQVRYLARKTGRLPALARAQVRPLGAEVRFLYNQEARSIWFLAPAFIVLVVMVSSPLLTALGVVREKETGSIYNIYASTVRRGEFLVGKLVPRVTISLVNVMILWLMARGLFGAPFKGSLLLFLCASLLYVLCTTGIGLLVSLLVRTQAAALIVTVVATFLPTILYSGVLVPVASLDEVARIEAHMFPGMYYNNVVLGTFLKGVGLNVLWLDVLALGLFALGLFTAGYLLFRKRPSV